MVVVVVTWGTWGGAEWFKGDRKGGTEGGIAVVGDGNFGKEDQFGPTWTVLVVVML